jgi:hypothetical protein
MPLLEFQCQHCNKSEFAFDQDECDKRFKTSCKSNDEILCNYISLPPKARTVHSTEIFMLSQLDSIHTVHELNSHLMREATEEREAQAAMAARREM